MANIDYQAQKKLLQAMDLLILKRLEDIGFKYNKQETITCDTAIIESVNADGTYDIKIRDDICEDTEAIAGTYVKNDVVYILKMGSEISKRKILCKVG